MLTFLRLIAWVAVIVVIAFAAFLFLPQRRTPPQPSEMAAANAAPDDGPLYAVRAADCAACHTAEGGTPFAGGRPIASPFGEIYSSNITPDPKTGIGGITLEEFRAVLYDGIGRDGRNLYPAMPYDSYRKLTEADVRALYAYVTEELAPVDHEVPETSLRFPFDQRWGIRAWKWVGLPSAGFEPRFDDPVLNRGAYLVEGPGHCGACHTPRNAFFAQDGTTSESARFLAGGEIGGWSTPDLRTAGSAIANWSAEDLGLFLASGRNAHAGVNGEMALVVAHSLQYLTPDDREAMVAYLRTIGAAPPPAAPPAGPPIARPLQLEDEPATETERLLASADPEMPAGARLYLDNCGACHFVDGQGADEIFPALDGNPLVSAESATGLISTILNGARLPSTGERPMAIRMPPFGDRLSDEEVAELASFVRGAWHNEAPVVTAEKVSTVRAGATSK